MQPLTKTYIKFIDFKDLKLWDVKRYSTKSIETRFPLVCIKNFATKYIDKVQLDDNTAYKRIRIKAYGKGVELRDIEYGEEIKTKQQFSVKTGQFIFSKIDARNGAFGIVPDELDKAIITNSFSVYYVNNTIANIKYLYLVTKTNYFQELCEKVSSGTTGRRNISDEHFINFQIPLPSLSEQNAIVAKYFAKINRAKELEKEAQNIEQEMEEYFLAELGIQKQEKRERKKGLQFVEFKDITRWDTLFLFGKHAELISKYELVSLRELIKHFNKDIHNKSIRFDSVKHPNEEFRYIGMEHVEKETGMLLDIPTVKGYEIKSQTLKIPKNFFIYGKLRPYLNKYWINDTKHNNIICSSEFFVFDVNEKVNKLFFKYILSSIIIQQQISDKTSGVRMPRINETVFNNLNFPLPPLTKQQEIVNVIQTKKDALQKLKTQAKFLKHQAETEFEQTIFM